ncbi:ABC transporter ATP-binding protein [Myxococcus llanfairpwllgwyngyllgogerychwyrndrobwllllantysiliogogogochensis]|uniref:ABC transporter ATP-binding protein n=1 Tax=Myxococcus llanfairpwllgwyngyllgogerychwyrndrobwllllantysiliogogogochensis TaxID=2590453 RepID=A0A540X7M2_9BACT|nr:ABC transporter ATP-binding protein [Myxococcus llanfairpwllgwyngyllgogerychwyrndrobwllllantysiliogogogochensis]TQF17295.1 ABC transporter ATP-binding protein [Myxococcus llanfairpwllgwyngyllgogerychwyrndrobwllllantysiliogogogochensis]
MSEVTLSGIKKSFGPNLIVKGVDLQVGQGEFLVMVGPSGCGKTTLLRLIAGLEQVDSGEVRIGGARVNDVPPRDRDVAMVFQSYALYPHMTVRENLAFGLTLRKFPPAEIASRVAEVATMLELGHLLERKPKALSGGQRQRVAMGRAIVRRPKVFLFDEPLSNLDTALRVQMRGELARLHRRLGATMIYVTHDQVEAMTLATRVAVFNAGVLQQVGPPLELYNRPANRFVAGFLGSPAMNFLEARREGANLVGKGFTLLSPSDLAPGATNLLVGLRPQDLRVAALGPLTGTVDAVERLGFDGYAFVSTEAGLVAARFDKGSQVSVGDRVSLSPVADALHVFTEDGSVALRHPVDRESLEVAS